MVASERPTRRFRRTSTVLFDDIAALEGILAAEEPATRPSTYGTLLTPTTAALSELLVAGEGGDRVILGPSGLSAIAIALLTMARSGDHLLVVDTAYGPTRELCDGLLTRLGVEIEYYDPLIGAGVADLIRPTTTAIWMESPGTHTFEIQDVPTIVAAARAADHRVLTGIDNTWGSPGLFRPFEHGLDVSVVAITKYWGGHADLVMGAVFVGEALDQAFRQTAVQLGMCTNGEDAFLAIRGARTAELRIRAHEAAASRSPDDWPITRASVGSLIGVSGLPGSRDLAARLPRQQRPVRVRAAGADGGPADAARAAPSRTGWSPAGGSGWATRGAGTSRWSCPPTGPGWSAPSGRGPGASSSGSISGSSRRRSLGRSRARARTELTSKRAELDADPDPGPTPATRVSPRRSVRGRRPGVPIGHRLVLGETGPHCRSR